MFLWAKTLLPFSKRTAIMVLLKGSQAVRRRVRYIFRKADCTRETQGRISIETVRTTGARGYFPRLAI